MPEEEEEELTEAADTNNHASKSMWAPAPPSDAPGRLKSFHSVADLRLTDDDVKRRKWVEFIMILVTYFIIILYCKLQSVSVLTRLNFSRIVSTHVSVPYGKDIGCLWEFKLL